MATVKIGRGKKKNRETKPEAPSEEATEDPKELQEPGIVEDKDPVLELKAENAIPDELMEPPKLTAALPLAEAVKQVEENLKPTLISGPSARDPNAPKAEGALKCSVGMYAAHDGHHPVHQAGFVAWCLGQNHRGEKTVAAWRDLYASYLKHPVK